MLTYDDPDELVYCEECPYHDAGYCNLYRLYVEPWDNHCSFADIEATEYAMVNQYLQERLAAMTDGFNEPQLKTTPIPR